MAQLRAVQRNIVLGVTCLVLGAELTALSAQLKGPSPKEVALLIESELAAADVPGAAIAVVAGEETVARGYGIANIETGDAMDAQTVVPLGSLTKLFTALAITSTLDQQAIRSTTTIGKYLDGLSPRASKATFHDLLSHSSGLRDRPGDSGTDNERELRRGASELRDSDFVLPPGAVFSYSNLGYALAGAAFEGLRKRPFADAMREALFAPLGMARSTFRPAEATAHLHAAGHRLKGQQLIVVEPSNDTRIWPAGYAWSSASDMVRLLSALVNAGRIYGRQAIPLSAITSVTTPHVAMPNVFVGGHYGYGLMIARDRTVLMYEHGGTLPGYSSMLRMTPGRRLGIAILTNVENAPLRRIAQTVMAKTLALPDLPPTARDEQPVTAAELKPFLGAYSNRGRAELAVQGEHVVLRLDQGAPMVVSRLGPDRFLARPAPDVAGPEFVLRAATRDVPAYLHFALWAYVRD